MLRVLVIAGTIDARQIVEQLLKYGVSVTATVTTHLGGSLLKQYEGVDIREGGLTLKEMMDLIHDINAGCVIDASHPFARDASLNSIEASKNMSIPYLRYERPQTQGLNEEVIRVKDFNEAVDKLKEFTGNIFLTIGSNKLLLFTGISDFEKRVFARVLPDSQVIAKCEELGLNANNILAIKGPFSVEMNVEMIKHCNASVVVTKDSGSAGGNEEKLHAAKKLGTPVIMIERPRIEYGCVVSNVDKVMEFVKDLATKNNTGK